MREDEPTDDDVEVVSCLPGCGATGECMEAEIEREVVGRR